MPGLGAAFHTRMVEATGHLMVLFSKDSPLAGHLPFKFRLLGLSRPWHYFTNALVTPAFHILPAVSLLWGIFPMQLNRWAALALTVYYPSLLLLKYYGTSLRHMSVMWFSYCSNVILWPTHFGALLGTIFGLMGPRRMCFIPGRVRAGLRDRPLAQRLPPLAYWF